MCGYERVHEGLEIWPPPLSKRVCNLPFIIDTFTGELGANWRESLIQSGLESFDFVVFGSEVVTWTIIRVRQIQFGNQIVDVAHSLKKAFAICNMSMCG